MYGVKEAREYMFKMREAVKWHLNSPDSMFYGKDGHLKLARACGVALNDFDNDGQKEILSSSYGIIYVSDCNLKPILDSKDWINELKIGKEKASRYWMKEDSIYEEDGNN